MIRRTHLLQHGHAIETKRDAYEYESGRNGLTTFIRRLGLAVLVVGREDREFDIPAWPNSETFRLGRQANLLMTDAQSRAWAALEAGPRASMAWFTWGDFVAPPPADMPDLKIAFRRRALAPTSPPIENVLARSGYLRPAGNRD
jgi:hypothetical protein